MPPVNSAAAWLEVWERGLNEPAWLRPLLLLAAGYPDLPTEVLARWSIGRREAALLRLREAAFGSQLTCLAACPQCSERLELSFRVDEIYSPERLEAEEKPDEPSAGDPSAGVPSTGRPDSGQVEAEGWTVRFRLPNSLDLAAASAQADEAAARRELLKRCLISVRPPGASEWQPFGLPLPEAVDRAITKAMSSLDPQATTDLALSCPNCGHAWEAPFDIGSYFWIELDAWARRMLREVHTLALAYGWLEADILSLSPTRRQAYLSLLAGG